MPNLIDSIRYKYGSISSCSHEEASPEFEDCITCKGYKHSKNKTGYAKKHNMRCDLICGNNQMKIHTMKAIKGIEEAVRPKRVRKPDAQISKDVLNEFEKIFKRLPKWEDFAMYSDVILGTI